MANLSKPEKFSRWFGVFWLNLIAVLLLCWLIVDRPGRWPVLVVAIPILLLANFVAIRRLTRGRPSIWLLVIYSCGLLYGVGWVAIHLTWWAPLLMLVPLAMFIQTLKRYKSESARRRVLGE